MDFFRGIVFGGITVGVITALNTPKNGKELRRDLKKEAKTLYEESICEIKEKF